MNQDRGRAPGATGAESFDAGVEPSAAASVAESFNAAVAQHRNGALGEAERRYRHVLMLDPAHADSLHNLGLIALHGGDARTAVDLIAKAIAVNDRTAEYHYNIALAWRALNRTDQAAQHLERAIGLRNDYALAHLNLGNLRREQNRFADAVACYERAVAASPNAAVPRFNLGNILSEQRRWDAAIASYRQVLALEPNHAEAPGKIAAALAARGNPRDAIPYYERTIALHPHSSAAHLELAKAYMSAGELQPAILAAMRALELQETADAKGFFAQCVAFARFTADPDGRLRRWVTRALAEAWIIPRDLSGACISLIRLDRGVNELIARADAAWPARLPAGELLSSSAMATLANDTLLRCVLEFDPITDIGLERLITSVRLALLAAAASDNGLDGDLLDFCCSVARQCFVNQYVFSATEQESAEAERLRTALERALAMGGRCPASWLAMVGAYFPLCDLPSAPALLDRSWPQSVRALIVQQVEEPLEERRLKATIPVLTHIAGDVSQAVREQYEENPYPRWVASGPPTQPAILDRRPRPVADILIAGCGTGLFTTEFARKAPAARFLAIDLSLASLSYAARMAGKLGLTNVEFAQADIMKIGAIGRTFDFIDSSGVLHHLADPWAGWEVLLSLLRPGGVMQVGLYSEIGRQNVVAARKLIAQRGYRPTPEDIRQMREFIASAQDGSLVKSVAQWSDFFTISECRDLLFHPQEHRLTLPQIGAFLDSKRLRFAGFILDALTADRFARRFPDIMKLSDFERFQAFADLDRWHAFETENPDTFAGMYRFWVYKPAADDGVPRRPD